MCMYTDIHQLSQSQEYMYNDTSSTNHWPTCTCTLTPAPPTKGLLLHIPWHQLHQFVPYMYTDISSSSHRPACNASFNHPYTISTNHRCICMETQAPNLSRSHSLCLHVILISPSSTVPLQCSCTDCFLSVRWFDVSFLSY